MKLPFKTAPQPFEKVTVGNSQIGELEIPKYYDLSPNERIFIKANTQDILDVRSLAMRFTSNIVKTSGKSSLETYNAMVQGDTAYLMDHLQEVIDFQNESAENSQIRDVVLATAIIRFRLAPEWAIEDTRDANKISPQLVSAIALFARNEESGWQQPDPDADDDDTEEEDLGNSNPQENPTGEKSSGESEDTGATITDLVPTTSDTNQPG